MSVKTWRQRRRRRDYCTRPWERLPATRHTHRHTLLNVVKILTLPPPRPRPRPSARLSSSSSSSLLSLIAGKVLIDVFPKLFLIKDKQIIHISTYSFLYAPLYARGSGGVDWLKGGGGVGGAETAGCSENNTSATSKWETWEVRL